MKFRIHYTINGSEDSFEVECETIAEGRAKADEFTNSRGIDVATCWSEKLEERVL